MILDDLITSTSNKICTGLTSERQKATAIFRYVRDRINYEFYYNSVYSPEATLKRGKANCCDSSRLIVALGRVQKLTVRFMHAKCYFKRSGKTIGHVFAQFYIDGKWITADPTSKYNDFGVVNNWSKSTTIATYQTLPF